MEYLGRHLRVPRTRSHRAVESALALLQQQEDSEARLFVPGLPWFRQSLIAMTWRDELFRSCAQFPSNDLLSTRHLQCSVDLSVQDLLVVHRRETLQSILLWRARRRCDDEGRVALLIDGSGAVACPRRAQGGVAARRAVCLVYAWRIAARFHNPRRDCISGLGAGQDDRLHYFVSCGCSGPRSGLRVHD